MTKDKPFIWRGKDLETMGETMKAIVAILDELDPKEVAREFMEAYVESGVDEAIVRENVGFSSGCCDSETARRILEVFDVSHPVFGRSQPSPKEAFETGRE